MLSTWKIAFDVSNPRFVHPAGVHAFLARSLSENSETHKRRKPYCIKGVSIQYGLAIVGVSLTDESSALKFSRIATGTPVQFGKREEGRGIVAAPPQLVRSTTWTELAAPRPQTAWRIELLSPMCFRRGKLSQPWPSPDKVLNSLLDSWKEGNNGEVPFAFPDVDAVAVTSARIETVKTSLTPTPTAGAVGELEWQWAPKSQDQSSLGGAAGVSALLSLAEFSGAGAYTQFGLGQANVSPPKMDRRGRRASSSIR